MRHNFSAKIKRKLAERVAWKCSFPNCGTPTIGPSKKNAEESTNLGEAAHIYAASENGPRNNPNLTAEELSSIENGIWMCRHHARLIDTDYTNYSAQTLKLWKSQAENNAYEAIKNPKKAIVNVPSTLIALGKEIVFEGLWKKIENNLWTFQIHHFITGTIEDVKSYKIDTNLNRNNYYVVIESQGDGRLLEDHFKWELVDEFNEIRIKVQDKTVRTDPNDFGGGMALGLDGDLVIENGDIKIIKGVDNAIQTMTVTLGIGFGELFF